MSDWTAHLTGNFARLVIIAYQATPTCQPGICGPTSMTPHRDISTASAGKPFHCERTSSSVHTLYYTCRPLLISFTRNTATIRKHGGTWVGTSRATLADSNDSAFPCAGRPLRLMCVGCNNDISYHTQPDDRRCGPNRAAQKQPMAVRPSPLAAENASIAMNSASSNAHLIPRGQLPR